MPKYSYIALDSRGSEKSGLLDAADVRQVAATLRAQGLFPTTVSPTPNGVELASPAPAPRFPNFRFRPAVSARELAAFTRQLGTLLRAGLPLLRGLEVLGRQEKNPRFRPVVAAIATSIRSGATLSTSLGPYPRIFDRLFLNMIKAGEAGGVLDTVLERLAHFQEKSLQLRGKLTAALVYPVIVLGVAVTILCGLLVLVVPKFQQIFADLLKGAPLPPLTRAVLTVSDLVRHHLPVVAGLAFAVWLGFRFFRRTAMGGRMVDTLVLKLPVFGDLMLRVSRARWAPWCRAVCPSCRLCSSPVTPAPMSASPGPSPRCTIA